MVTKRVKKYEKIMMHQRFLENQTSLEHICIKKKFDQKVTAGEIQQSIYGAVVGELNSLEEFSSVLRHCFLSFSV